MYRASNTQQIPFWQALLSKRRRWVIAFAAMLATLGLGVATAMPAAAAVVTYHKGKTCVDGVYRIQVDMTWEQINPPADQYAPVTIVVTHQHFFGNPAAWRNQDWSVSAHIFAVANGSIWGAQYGPKNPGTSITFNFTGQGWTNKAGQSVTVNTSNSGLVGAPNIHCVLTP